MTDDGLDPTLYERHAAAWAERRRELGVEQPWLDRLSELLPPGSRILDLGCGTGQPIAEHLISLGHQVTGVDQSSSLLTLARRRFPGHRWLLGDMRSVDPGSGFAAAVAWCSLFHLVPADQRALLGRVAELLAPGGLLLLTTGDREGVAIGEFEGERLYHASLSPQEYRRLLSAHGFEVLEHALHDPAYDELTVWLARLTPAPSGETAPPGRVTGRVAPRG